MKDELRRMNKSAFARSRRLKSAIAVSAAADAAKVEAGWPKKAEIKSEKWFFAIFHLEPAAVQSLPTKIGGRHFSDFSRNFRGYTGGDVMPECYSDRYPNGVVKTTQPRVTRLTSHAPSQSVAVSRSDKIIIRAGCPRPFLATLRRCACVSSPFFEVKKSRPIKLNQSESK